MPPVFLTCPACHEVLVLVPLRTVVDRWGPAAETVQFDARMIREHMQTHEPGAYV
jgi:hypothetical protein